MKKGTSSSEATSGTTEGLSCLRSAWHVVMDRWVRWRLLAVATFSFVMTFCLMLAVIYTLAQQDILEKKHRVAREAERTIRLLEQSLGQALSATHAIAALVKQGNGSVNDFEGTAQQMMSLYPGVGALQLAPGGVIRQSVPLAGNERAIGHNLLQDPGRNKEAFLARDTGKLTLAGPFKLIQGGTGAVGRLPIFLPSAEGMAFWGFSTVLVRFPDVLNSAGLHKMRDAGYHYVLWRVHPDTGVTQVIEADGPEMLEDSITEKMMVPNGSWMLSVKPVAGWGNPFGSGLDLAVGAIISILIASMVYFLLRQPLILRREVEKRTQQLKESEARFQALFDKAPAPLAFCSNPDRVLAEPSPAFPSLLVEDGPDSGSSAEGSHTVRESYTQWNDAWLKRFGYEPDVMQGCDEYACPLWVDPRERRRYVAMVLERGDVHGIEVTLRRGDGEERLVSLSGHFILAGERRLLLTHYDDITETRRAEQALHQLNASLEERVENRTRALRQTNDELLEAMSRLETTQKELFRSEKMAALGALVAGIAHELNTPIGIGITVSTSLTDRLKVFRGELEQGLRRSRLEVFLDEIDHAFVILFDNMRRAAELVASFKQVAIDQASQVRRRFDIATTVNEIVMAVRPTLKRRPLQIKTRIPAGLEMDSYPGPLGQVLFNLINNAVAHAFDEGQSGEIEIRVEMLELPETGEPWIRLSVTDNGKGIQPEHMARIFDPFFTTKLGAGGSGLGLNITFNIVTNLLQGHIEAYSTPGQGSRFEMEIPCRVREEVAELLPGAGAPAMTNA